MITVKTKITIVLLTLCLFCGNIPVNVFGTTWVGAGTKENPYLITTAEQFFAIPAGTTDYFKLANDLDLKDYPNRILSDSFSGVFDGDNHKILNFKINAVLDTPVRTYALFPTIVEGTIKNLVVENPKIECGSFDGSVSVLVGSGLIHPEAKNPGTRISKIQNCHVVGGEISKKQGIAPVSGIVSYAGETVISNCSSTANITAKQGNAYGISADGGTIENCFVLGDIWAKDRAYGIGRNATVTNSYFAGRLFSSKEGVGISQKQELVNGYPLKEEYKLTSCYFDKTLLPITSPSSQARTTQQMFQKANYEGWNFDTVWGIDEGKGYPYLLETK